MRFSPSTFRLTGLLLSFALVGLALGCVRSSPVNFAEASDLHNESGDFFSEDALRLMIVGTSMKPVDLARLDVSAIRASDARGTEYPWKVRALPDSLNGPGIHLSFDAKGAASPVDAEATLDYRGTVVFVKAKWEKSPAGVSPWRLVSCEFRRR